MFHSTTASTATPGRRPNKKPAIADVTFPLAKTKSSTKKKFFLCMSPAVTDGTLGRCNRGCHWPPTSIVKLTTSPLRALFSWRRILSLLQWNNASTDIPNTEAVDKAASLSSRSTKKPAVTDVPLLADSASAWTYHEARWGVGWGWAVSNLFCSLYIAVLPIVLVT